MKTYVNSVSVVAVAGVIFSVFSAARLDAQAFHNLHAFVPTDGWFPLGQLVLSTNTLYGTTQWGGISNYGTLFRIDTDGSNFSILHNFTGGDDGGSPHSGLVKSNDTLYGTARGTGGTVFRVNTDGTGFSVLHSFASLNTTTNSGGALPEGGLCLSDGVLFGTTSAGGASGNGTVFRVNTDGTGFTNLYDFSAGDGFTNTDGAVPLGDLIVSGNTLYGTTFLGGNWGSGTVFAINTDGTGFRALYSFAPEGPLQFSYWPNVGGGNPRAGLVLSGGILYGTAWRGGHDGGGTIFKVDPKSVAFANLHDFSGAPGDGFHPYCGLVLSGNILYGTTQGGSAGNFGTVFAINTDGSGFHTLFNFGISEGAGPETAPTLSGNTLYGVTTEGANSYGSIYSLFIQPQLTINPLGQNMVLAWPTNSTGFALQTATNLAPPVSWTTFSPTPVIINDLNTLTDRLDGVEKFYRLAH